MTCPAEGLQRIGRGCLFRVLVSVVLSVTLTVLVNLVLHPFCEERYA